MKASSSHVTLKVLLSSTLSGRPGRCREGGGRAPCSAAGLAAPSCALELLHVLSARVGRAAVPDCCILVLD